MESLHPVTVHFPIALIFSVLLIETMALAWNRPHWHRISLWNLLLGALGAVAAVVTGRQAMTAAKHSPEIHRVMNLHERLGYFVLVSVLSVALFRILLKDRLNIRQRWVAWGLLFVTCSVLAFSAHLGGRLVYEFGVGGRYGRGTGIEVVR